MMADHAGPRVIVDATAVPADRGGVGRYVDGLLSALSGDIVIACQARDAEYYGELAPDSHVLPQRRIGSAPARLLWEQLVFPSVARHAGAAVIFSPHYTTPLASRLPRVVTFHDATFFSDPAVHTRTKGVFFRRWIRVSAAIARRIIVPSAATATELERYVRRPAGYDVALHGVDPSTFHKPTADEVADFRDEFGIGDRPWIGFLGTEEPRKNLPALVRAYGALTSHWQPAWGEVPTLLLAGGRGWEVGVDAEIAEVGPTGSVRRLGFVPVDRLRAFLGGAALVCYPSLGEGFGLPVLEAMACAAPVLTTRRLAIPEVGGDAVAYTGVSADAIAEGLRELLSRPAERARLAAAGHARAQKFTWRASARIHESVFRAAAAPKERS